MLLTDGDAHNWSDAAVTRDLAEDVLREAAEHQREPAHRAPTTILAALQRLPRSGYTEIGLDMHRLLAMQGDFLDAVRRIPQGTGDALQGLMNVYNGTLRAWPMLGSFARQKASQIEPFHSIPGGTPVTMLAPGCCTPCSPSRATSHFDSCDPQDCTIWGVLHWFVMMLYIYICLTVDYVHKYNIHNRNMCRG